jgi:monoamine oxidase
MTVAHVVSVATVVVIVAHAATATIVAVKAVATVVVITAVVKVVAHAATAVLVELGGKTAVAVLLVANPFSFLESIFFDNHVTTEKDQVSQDAKGSRNRLSLPRQLH